MVGYTLVIFLIFVAANSEGFARPVDAWFYN